MHESVPISDNAKPAEDAQPPVARPTNSLAMNRWSGAFGLFRAMRPLQWTKNAIVLAALVFDERLLEGGSLARGIAAVLVFCAVSSAIYIINDLRDVAADRLHPRKRHRPIAARLVSPMPAIVLALSLLAAGLVGAYAIRPGFLAVISGYILLMVAYSYALKRLVLIDVFAIAAGFVLRAAGGAVAIGVPISPWLYVCTMLLALFIGFAKRRHEMTSLEAVAVQHRANLDAYTVPLLDQLITIVAASTLMAYSLYTFDAATVPTNHAMMLTVPFVVYAMFRYLFLIHRRDGGGSPETLLFKDAPLLGSILCWGVVSVAILYLAG